MTDNKQQTNEQTNRQEQNSPECECNGRLEKLKLSTLSPSLAVLLTNRISSVDNEPTRFNGPIVLLSM